MADRPTTPDDVAKTIERLIDARVDARVRASYVATEGSAGDPAGGDGFANPMTEPGQLITSVEDGAAIAIGPGTEGQVPTVQADGSVAFADLPPLTPGGGDPGPPSPTTPGARYRHFVLAEDGSGGWSFVIAAISGQDWPVTALHDVE